MQLLELILYSHEGETRRLEFRRGELNVITGIADTGKTAVLEIVHYCLGDDEDIRIPRPMITQVVAWFAVRVRIGDLEVFIARPSPEHPQFANNAVALDVGSRALPPLEDLEPTTTLDGLNAYLSRLLRIDENLSILPEPSRLELEARFRHSLFYCFQRQHEVANPEQLFHRQGQPFIKTTIQDTLPYFLGAAPDDHVERQRELRRLRQELRAAVSELEGLHQTRSQALKRGLTLLSQARDVGLTEDATEPADTATAVTMLRSAADSRAGLLELSAEAGRELRRIERRRLELANKLRSVRDEIDLVRTLNTEGMGYESAVTEQAARLHSLEILPHADGDICPLCERPTDGVVPGVSEVADLLRVTSRRLEAAQREAPRLQAVLDRLEEQQAGFRQELEATQSALRALLEQRREVERYRERLNTQSYVRGRIAQYLDSVQEADDTRLAEAQLRVTQLEQRVEAFEDLLGPQALRDRVDAILGAIGQDMHEWAARLHLRHSDSAVEIHPTKLTIVARTPHGPIYLPEMGGGASWVGYHLVSHLALHKHFVNEQRPVPRFLFLDQMSQAFYPPDTPAPSDLWGTLDNDDRERVRAMYLLIHDVVQSLHGELQVIATDHARLDESWFLDTVREDWHTGERLVPQSWIPPEYLQA